MDYRIRFIDTNLKSYGSSAIDMPDTLFSQDALKNMVKGFGSENWTTDPQIDYIADKLGVDPLTVLNRQLKANGMDALPPSPAIEVVNKLTPTQQRLLNKFKTPERSTRGLMGVTAYSPEIIPKGYGEVIQSAAKKYGIDPSILAGIIETESSWDSAASNPSGARGIAQIIPKWHPGVNVNDPVESINYAASYLRRIMDGENGTGKPVDINTAIYMYNAGPYRSSYPYGEENTKYLPKVLRSAGKYGYGKQALRDPAIFRPSIL